MYDEGHQEESGGDESYTRLPLQRQTSSLPAPTLAKLTKGEKDINGVGGDPSFLTNQNDEQKTWYQKPESDKSESQSPPLSLFPSSGSKAPPPPGRPGHYTYTYSRPKVSLPKHVPVVQVSSYKPGKPIMRRTKSESKIRNNVGPPVPRKSGSLIQTKNIRDSVKTNVVKVDRVKMLSGKLDTEGEPLQVMSVSEGYTQTDQPSPGSRELLAANVLVEGFAKDKT